MFDKADQQIVMEEDALPRLILLEPLQALRQLIEAGVAEPLPPPLPRRSCLRLPPADAAAVTRKIAAEVLLRRRELQQQAADGLARADDATRELAAAEEAAFSLSQAG